jgi:hypothetical protein
VTPTPSPSTLASPTPSPTATPTLTPSPSPSPEPTLPPEAAIDVSHWAALDWSQGTLESSEGRNRVAVRDVLSSGTGFVAVGYAEDWSTDPPARALVWLSDDGLDWRLVSDGSSTFAAMEPCCVMRARDAYIAWTRDRGSFLSSVDGVTWTRTEHTGGGEQFAVTETTDGLFGLAAPFDGRAWTTTDGMTWHDRQTSGLRLKAFGRHQLVATDFGYLLAAEAARGGIFDGCGLWASWYSTDGLAWEEFQFAEGRLWSEGARNAGWLYRYHQVVYASERPQCGFSFDWAYEPVWRSADGVDWELADGSFAEHGLFDGQFTLDLRVISGTTTVRLSPDGVTFLELEAAGAKSPPYDAWPWAVGNHGVVVFANDSGPRPSVWFGQAVVDVSPSLRPAVYCGSVDAATCLYLVRQVASERTPAGTAFVVSPACRQMWWLCSGSELVAVAVPPNWPDSGKLRRWVYDDGDLSRGRVTGVAEHITDRLPQDGPWADALVGDQLWVQFRHIDSSSIYEVMNDTGLSGPVTVKPVGDVLWYAVGIIGRWPAASKLALLRDDPRVCAADFVRFDPSILRGEGDVTPLPPPDATGCS